MMVVARGSHLAPIIILLIVSDSGRHLMVMRLMDDGVVVPLSLALVITVLILGIHCLINVQRSVVHIFCTNYLAVVGQNRRIIDCCVARII